MHNSRRGKFVKCSAGGGDGVCCADILAAKEMH